MKKVVKQVNTMVVIAWVMLSVMYFAGAPEQGEVFRHVIVSSISLGLALLLGKALYAHDLMITEKDEEGIDDEW